MLLLATIILSCKKKDDSPKEPTTVMTGKIVGADFLINYKNANGQNLLNLGVPNALNTQCFVIYDLDINGQKVSYYDSSADRKQGFAIYNEGSNNFLLMTYQGGILNNDTKRMVRFIKYSDGTEDKFEGEFKITSSQFILEKLWVNGQLHASTRDAVKQNIVQLVK